MWRGRNCTHLSEPSRYVISFQFSLSHAEAPNRKTTHASAGSFQVRMRAGVRSTWWRGGTRVLPKLQNIASERLAPQGATQGQEGARRSNEFPETLIRHSSFPLKPRVGSKCQSATSRKHMSTGRGRESGGSQRVWSLWPQAWQQAGDQSETSEEGGASAPRH